jgi:hypothetical protein
MLDQLVSSTANIVQTNVKLIRESYPVTVLTEKVRTMMGYKEDKGDKEDKEEKEDNIDKFNDTSPSSWEYISVVSMFKRTFAGEKLPWDRWFYCILGILLTYFVVSFTANYMIMLPMAIRLFATLYLLNIGIYSDFTGINLIYYTAFAYGGIMLYRRYLKTMNPDINIIPFNWDSNLPLRTVKNDWLDTFNYLWSYLPEGAVGVKYNNIVRTTDEYIKQQKSLFPDYEELKGQFNLEPLYEKFENHMIDMNLPGYIPESVATSASTSTAIINSAKAAVGLANATTKLATATITLSNASEALKQEGQ